MDIKPKHIIVFSVAIAAIILLVSQVKITLTTMFAKITSTGTLRGKDAKGNGAFGAPRDGGKRKHQGLDFAVTVGEKIFSPIDGTIRRSLIAYDDDNRYKGVEIFNDDVTVKMFYLIADKKLIGKKVVAGQAIGTAQDLNIKYGFDMKNHVHIEAKNSKGERLNPEKLFTV